MTSQRQFTPCGVWLGTCLSVDGEYRSNIVPAAEAAGFTRAQLGAAFSEIDADTSNDGKFWHLTAEQKTYWRKQAAANAVVKEDTKPALAAVAASIPIAAAAAASLPTTSIAPRTPEQRKDPSMSTKTTELSPEDARKELARRVAILTCAEATGRERMAMCLAENTHESVASARALMELAGVEPGTEEALVARVVSGCRAAGIKTRTAQETYARRAAEGKRS